MHDRHSPGWRRRGAITHGHMAVALNARSGRHAPAVISRPATASRAADLCSHAAPRFGRPTRARRPARLATQEARP